MADKTTTLKTKTNDNVYPNVIGDNRKNAFADSSTITHHFFDKTHKVGFQINNETNIKIQNSLQKPKGLTKTELVGVGANGQENIEIGDNLTLANGKLSATGGGSGGVELNILVSNDFNPFSINPNSTDYQQVGTYTGTIDKNKINILRLSSDSSNSDFLCISLDGTSLLINFYGYTYEIADGNIIFISNLVYMFTHFITMKDSASNIVLYLTIQNADVTEFTSYTLAKYLINKKILANGNLHGVVPTYIAGEGGIIKVYYMTPGDNNINPTPDEYQDLSSFEISDSVKLDFLGVISSVH